MANAATAVEGAREKWHRMGMLIHEMLTACLWVFLGRHSGLSWDIRRPDGLLGINQSAPAMLGELFCDPTKSSTFHVGPALGVFEALVLHLCPRLQLRLLLQSSAVSLFVHSFVRSFLPPAHFTPGCITAA